MPRKPYLIICPDCKYERFTKNKGQTGVCRKCLGRRNHKIANAAAVKKRTLRPYESLFRVLCREAKRSNREVFITYEQFLDFVAQNDCFYCSGLVSWNTTAYNLDRINNEIDYEYSNLVVCCGRCNRVKSSEFTHKEFIKIGKLLREIDVERIVF